MSTALVQLDDIAYSDLLGGAIERIPAASQGRWTLHAPVDPGITLLELFAHLLDQRVYWLDQESDEQLRAVLALIGEAPRHAAAAATVVRLVDRSGDAPTASRQVPAATSLELAAQGAAVTTSVMRLARTSCGRHSSGSPRVLSIRCQRASRSAIFSGSG